MQLTVPPRTAAFYTGYVLLWTAIITGGGAIVGAIIFPIVGTLADMEMTVPAMIWSGARQIGFLTFIWAFGIAVVMAFQRAHRHRSAQAPSPSSSSNDG